MSCVSELLQAGAGIDCVDEEKRTPLQLAQAREQSAKDAVREHVLGLVRTSLKRVALVAGDAACWWWRRWRRAKRSSERW